ncbi:MAG TPA: four-carbon acid sugar kinase family protein [Thermomicrobiales bacterium]|nr:four-carbon acid sugar kinase family protein [Thermomicrobiales bacterium]
MTAPRAIVVADDLTGAADAGAPFAAAGFATAVPLRSAPPDAEVIALSNDTRDASGDRIEELFRQSMDRVPPADPSTLWYAKVDSVFRGFPGPQVAFLLRQTSRRAVVIAPALPDQRRATVDGNVYVDDVLLTESNLGAGHASASVISLLGLPEDLGHSIDLDTVRSGADALRHAIDHVVRPIVVVDAETNADLAILAGAVAGDSTHLLAGSAGFAKQLAVQLGERAGKPHRAGVTTPVRSVLTVAGSRHATSARQGAALAATGIETLHVSFEHGHLTPQATERTIERLQTEFELGRSVTLTTCETPRSLMPGHEIARALAALATDPRVRDRYDAMILTGGDVAAAVCSKLDAVAIRLGGEVLPAIPWGTLEGGMRPGLPVVTKAGSFGDDLAMMDAVAFLTQITN